MNVDIYYIISVFDQIRTEFGLPLSPERPLICSMTITSLWIMWFTANPKTFGSASTVYEIQCCGDGKVCEHTLIIITSLTCTFHSVV